MMNLQTSILNDYTTIDIQGRIDTISASEFEATILPVIEPGVNLVINCSGLDYISSTGLRVFLLAQKKAKAAGCQLRLCCLKPAIREIFDISGFSSIFTLCADLESAIIK